MAHSLALLTYTSASEEGMPCIAYDAQAFLSANGGTGKGVQLRNLLGPYANRFLGFATKDKNNGGHALIQQGYGGYRVWQQTSLPYLLHKWKVDYFLAPYNTAPLFIPKRTRLILVLHDLILLEQSLLAVERSQRLDHLYRRLLIYKAVSRSHVVLTVSKYSKRQIEARFPGTNVHMIPCSIAPSWFDAQSRRSIENRDNYVLLVTSGAAHKNTVGALRAFQRHVQTFGASRVARLKIVGLWAERERFRAFAAELGIDAWIDVEPYASDAELQGLYRRARALLVPSFMEGFGIPILEAMASGTPVISSITGSLPEVGGTAARYFDPTNIDEMASALTEVLGDLVLQRQMSDAGIAQAQLFHPERVQVEVKQFWKHLANGASTLFASSRTSQES